MKGNGAHYKWELFGWLWLAFFLNQADRQIFNIALPAIKDDLALTDVQMGLVSSLFILTIGLFIPIAGFAGDLFSRKKIIVFSLFFWSLATLLTGISSGLPHLILFRSLAVGGGEAFYAPAANTLISQYHRKTRALALSVHQTSLYVGVVVSGVVGGVITEQYGWRSAFFSFGAVGIIAAALLLWRIKPGNVWQEGGSAPLADRAFFKAAVSALFKKTTALLLGLAFACLVFVNVGYLTWTPTFLHEHFGLGLADAGFSSMFYHHLFAFLGIILGGLISDKLALRHKKSRLIIQGGGLLFGAPFIFGVGAADSPQMSFFFLGGFGLFRGIYEANLYASLFDVITPAYRSTSVGIISMFSFISGAIAPALLGAIKPAIGLDGGISLLSVAYVLGSICVFLAYRYFFDIDKIIEPKT